MNGTPRWFETKSEIRVSCLNEVKRVSRAIAMTNPMSTDGHQILLEISGNQIHHSNLAPHTEHSLASTGMSAPHAPHSAVSAFFCRLLTPRLLLFSAAAALTGSSSQPHLQRRNPSHHQVVHCLQVNGLVFPCQPEPRLQALRLLHL